MRRDGRRAGAGVLVAGREGAGRIRLRDRGRLALLLIAVAGALVSVYLTAAHYAGAELVCTQGGIVDCEAVTSSSYSLIPGSAVPISVAGLVWSAMSGALALAQSRVEPRWVRPAHLAWAAGALVVVLYLVDAEIRVIGRICEWCTVLHLLVAATFFLALRRVTAAPVTPARTPTSP